MADLGGSPGSNAESSINIGKAGAPKDKACPFCQQPFTSSSLGRHLDLYIKEKNPKPADGVHDVDEIRKLRGGITRRQPRNSLAKRESSTPTGTPGLNGSAKRSPPSEIDQRSPKFRTRPMDLSHDGTKKTLFNSATWHATGVINDIPSVSQNGIYVEGNGPARIQGVNSVSQDMLAEANLEQKQKMMDALDTAKAAELALRELLGSLKAATERVEMNASPFDYDPLSLDFPALTLHCLPPPPTINQVTPVPSPNSWSIMPPEQQQYDALRAHFHDAFHRWRISLAMSTAPAADELDPDYDTRHHTSEHDVQLQAASTELEEKISSHLNTTFKHWSSLTPQSKAEVWRLNLARSVGFKENTIQSLKSSAEKMLQENSHLRAQVEQLSRCQQPREFQMVPPSTLHINSKVALELGNRGVRGNGYGLSIADKDETVEALVEKTVSRWKAVVLASRGAIPQQNLPQQIGKEQTISAQQIGVPRVDDDMDLDADAEGDADADGEGEEIYGDINGVPGAVSMTSRAPEAPMMMGPYGTGKSKATGNGLGHNGTNGSGQVGTRWRQPEFMKPTTRF